MFMRILVFAFLSILTCPNHLPAVDIFQEQRQTMVTRDIKGRGIRDRRVLAAMEKIPRHLLVGERYRHEAYADRPLPIGEGQTISQPYVVALMTEALKLVGMAHPRAKVYQPISSSLLSPGKMARAVPLAAKPSMAMLMTNEGEVVPDGYGKDACEQHLEGEACHGGKKDQRWNSRFQALHRIIDATIQSFIPCLQS